MAADWPLSGHPLRGVRVVELTHVAAGPFAGMLLADLGADVVKLEPPTGDQMRSWPPIAEDTETGEQFSHNFASVNRNKRSVVVDLKDTGHGVSPARGRSWPRPTSWSRTTDRACSTGSGSATTRSPATVTAGSSTARSPATA